MRIISFLLFAAFFIGSCKPKDKGTFFKDLANPDKNREKTQDDPRQLIVGKWRITETVPTSESDRDEVINSILEFTSDGRLYLTSKDKREQVATVTFTFDNKYLLSRGDHDELDTMLIQELSKNRMVLSSVRENKTLVAERSN